MNFINSLFNLFILHFFYISASGENFDAAPIIIKKGKFQLANPMWVQTDKNKTSLKMEFSLPLPPWNQIYQFCPPSTDVDNSDSALKLVQVNRDSRPVSICHELPKPVVTRVSNAKDLKKNWSDNFEWYVNGFKIDIGKIIEELNIPSQKFDSGFLYESVTGDETVVPRYSVFYDKSMKQVIAAQYNLLPANMYSGDNNDFHPGYYERVQTPDLNNMNEFFKDEKFTRVYQGEKPQDVRSCEKLVQATLISPPHFIYWFYKRMAWMNINLIPMRMAYSETHRKINEFLETVAKKLGKLKITSGISGLGSTTEEQEKRRYINFENDLKILVPDFLWKVVEFKFMNAIYGIVLIQINTLFEPENKICEDVCSKYKWSIRSEEEKNIVYCCDMTVGIIEKLEAPFLGLEERQEFDLTSWGFDLKTE